MFSSVSQISHLPPYAGECCAYDLLSDGLVEMLAKLNVLSPVLMSHHPFGSSRFDCSAGRKWASNPGKSVHSSSTGCF